MVDDDLLEGNSLARQGMVFLMESGVLPEMKARLLERLAAGSPEESEETMLNRIREYRIHLSFVDSLIYTGEKIRAKENENEPR